ncbi:MAG: hemerythrin domain-containing protein [Acidobacteriota bacterium]
MSDTEATAKKLLDEHSALKRRAVTLEGLVTDPVRLDAELGAIEGILRKHFDMEEVGGYMSAVRSVAPGEEANLRRLRGDHDDLWGRLRQLRQMTSRAAPEGELRDRLREWLDLLARHESEEHQLITRHLGDPEAK